MTKHILITGAAGFIGRHLCHHLSETTPWRLTALVGLRYADDLPALLGRLGGRDTRIIFHDLRAPIPESVAQTIGEVDCIVNLAGESHVDRSIQEPAPFVANNFALALHLLEYARQVRPGLFIHMGTDEVFGPAPEGVAFPEWDRYLPSNPYAASKCAQDALAIAWWRTYGVPVVLARTMNNFGPGQHPEKLIPKACRALLAGQAVPLHARLIGGQWDIGSRCWLHARNTADALRFIIERVEPTFYPAADRPPAVNIAGQVELTNLEVVERIARILGVPCRYEFMEEGAARPGHDHRYALSPDLLTSLGWSPPLDFERAFTETVRSYLPRQLAGA